MPLVRFRLPAPLARVQAVQQRPQACRGLLPAVWQSRPPPSSCQRAQCLPGSAEALLGDNGKAVSDAKVDSKEVEALRKCVSDLEERVGCVEGELAQLKEQVRDRAVSLAETLKQPSVDKLEQLQLQDTAAEKTDEDVDLDGLLNGFTEALSKGYLEAAHRLRDRLLVTEWELTLKPLAMRQGVASFQAWCADNPPSSEAGDEGMEALSEQLNALYEDPTKLETIQDPRLRLRAAAFINQSVVAAQQAAYERCSDLAQNLASEFAHGDLISKLLPEGGVVDALKQAAGMGIKAILPKN